MTTPKTPATAPTDPAPATSKFWYDSRTDGPMRLGYTIDKRTGVRTYPDGSTGPDLDDEDDE